MVLACVIAASHAYLVERERAAWTVITVAMVCWTFGEDLVRRLRAGDVSVDGGPRVHRVLPAPVRRHRPPAPFARSDDRGHALARRHDGRARRRRVRRRRDLRARRRRHAGLDLRRRDEPLVPARGRAAPLGRLRRLLAHRLAPGAALAAPRARRALDRARRHRLPLPVRGRNVRRGHLDRHPLARGTPPDRVRLRGCTTARAPGSTWRDVRCSPFRRSARSIATGILVYDHFVRLNILAIVLATATLALVVVRLGDDVPREPPPLRAHASGGDHRCADGAREPSPAAHRPRAPSARRLHAADTPHAVRPRRIQELQRHVRPPGRRRAAHAPRRETRGRTGRRRCRLSARRGRVLPPRDGRGR